MTVSNLSSISCVCTKLEKYIPVKNSEIVAIIHKKQLSTPEVQIEKSKEAVAINDLAIENIQKQKNGRLPIAKVNGRISVSSYTVSSNDSLVPTTERLKYNISLNINKIANTGLSAETYLSYTHKLGESATMQENLRIYNLALKYELGNNNLILGRKINPNMANIGAVDGLQYQHEGKAFSYGALIGSRPDTYYYSFNPTLLQAGAFIGHHFQNSKGGSMNTTAAIFNQTNNLVTDRRFLYIQHSNSLLHNLDLFGSTEIDLYGKVNNQLTTTFDLTSVYLSLRYRPIKKLSTALTYDARKNVYYYETYKNYIDSLLDKETRQGLRFQFNYRPLRFLYWGGTAGYRMATTYSGVSQNANTYLTYTQLPWIGASLTGDFTWLKTDYTSGLIYGGTLSRDFIKGKFYTELSYRKVDYTFTSSKILNEQIGDISISWQIAKKLLLSADFEGSIDSDDNMSERLYINLTQRF